MQSFSDLHIHTGRLQTHVRTYTYTHREGQRQKINVIKNKHTLKKSTGWLARRLAGKVLATQTQGPEFKPQNLRKVDRLLKVCLSLLDSGYGMCTPHHTERHGNSLKYVYWNHGIKTNSSIQLGNVKLLVINALHMSDYTHPRKRHRKRTLADWCASRGEGYQCEDACLCHKHSYTLNNSADTKCHLLLVRTVCVSFKKALGYQNKNIYGCFKKKKKTNKVFFLLSGEKI